MHVVFDQTLTIANLVATLAILVTLISLLHTNLRDRDLKRRQYADKIRDAAALLTAKLERWRDLSLSLFEELQPYITEADMQMVKDQNQIAVRDCFWKNLTIVKCAVSGRIRDEEVELAYAALYSYSTEVRELFLSAVELLRVLRESSYESLAAETQGEILRTTTKTIESAVLGNALRMSAGDLAETYAALAVRIVDPFRQQMIAILEASDVQIEQKQVKLLKPADIFPSMVDIRRSSAELVYETLLSRRTLLDKSRELPSAHNQHRWNFNLIDR